MTDPGTHPSDLDLWLAEDSRVVSHLQVCAVCRERQAAVVAEQDAVRLSLAPLAGPVEPPQHVVQRLARALADERPVVVPLPAATTVRPSTRWRPRLLAAAAALAAVVVVGGGLLLPALEGPTGDLSASDVAGTAGGEADTRAEAAPEAEAGAATSDLPALPDDLLQLAEALTGSPAADDLAGQAEAAVPPDCGLPLAADVDGTLVATAALEGRAGVVVVVDGPDGRSAWWLPSCSASVDTALARSALPAPTG